jgi:PPOX class probable FMN-dependent enzyme
MKAVTSEAELREIAGHPQPIIRDKAITVIDEQTRLFLAKSTFFLLATTGADGSVDVSPRGEPDGGGVVVLGPGTLAFADRPGNKRLDSFRNIIAHPRVGLIFLVPGIGDTIRINGKATVVRDADFAGGGLGVVVEVEELFLHCTQAPKRAGLWDPEKWPDPSTVPTAGQIWKSHLTHIEGRR